MGKIKAKLKVFLDNDIQMFKLMTGLKFTLLTIVFAILAITSTFILLKIDLIFFETYGFTNLSDYRQTFYEFIFRNLWDQVPYVILSMIFIFLGGYYVATIMMRPFKLISQCCQDRMKNETRFYTPDLFSDLKLLTSFTAFFFSKIDEAKVRGKLDRLEIPADYTSIHKPIWEKNFFLNYGLLIIILALMASAGIFILNNEIREQVLLFSAKLIKANPQVKYFLDKQYEVLDNIIYVLLFLHLVINMLFGLHLYNKVATPAFAVFATLRSFIKGNYHNRIHLIGYYYLRDDCREINKYLDKIQKDLT
jgi:hypothetical protein